MFEQLKINILERRPYLSFFIGIGYVFISFFSSQIFFPKIASIATLFLVTLLLIPTVIKLMNIEEKRESKDGITHFIRDHKDIFEIYIFLFIGVFAGALILALFFGTGTFEYQMGFLESREGLSSELIKTKTQEGVTYSLDSFLGLVENNLIVIILAFILSLFYGAGAMFLIVLNASIFSTFVAFVMKELPTMTNKLAILGIFSVHMVPELLGFLLVAIAGGVISKAVMKERFLSNNFRNVMRDAFMLFIIAAFVIVLAAFLETYVTTWLFNTFLVA